MHSWYLLFSLLAVMVLSDATDHRHQQQHDMAPLARRSPVPPRQQLLDPIERLALNPAAPPFAPAYRPALAPAVAARHSHQRFINELQAEYKGALKANLVGLRHVYIMLAGLQGAHDAVVLPSARRLHMLMHQHHRELDNVEPALSAENEQSKAAIRHALTNLLMAV